MLLSINDHIESFNNRTKREFALTERLLNGIDCDIATSRAQSEEATYLLARSRNKTVMLIANGETNPFVIARKAVYPIFEVRRMLNEVKG